VRGRGGVDRVDGMVEDWRDTRLIVEDLCGAHGRFGGLGLKTSQRYG
jgi:hypothetical protein